jgi:predicted nucleic acid-binding protein
LVRAVFDTDVVSAVFRRRLPASLVDVVADYQMVITLVTVGELWTWAEQRSWNSATRDRLTAWLGAAEVINWDMAVAETWGALMDGPGDAAGRGQ